MGKIFRKLNFNAICEFHPCSNKAKYGIGDDDFPNMWLNVCPQCMKLLMFEASMQMDEDISNLVNEYAKENIHEQIENAEAEAIAIEKQRIIDQREREERARKIALIEDYVDPITKPLQDGDLDRLTHVVEQLKTDEELKAAISKKPEDILEQIKEASAFVENKKHVESTVKETEMEFYECKYCGKKFERPAELTAFRAHSRTCYKNHPEKYKRVQRAKQNSQK